MIIVTAPSSSVLIQRYNVDAVLATFTPGWNVAVPALVLVFSLIFSPQNLYYQGWKLKQLKNDNNNNNKNYNNNNNTPTI